jgi:hypothetical protein
LSSAVETQQGVEKYPVLNDSLDPVIPILREAQRGFFKKGGKGWRKEIIKSERLSVDKELFLEKIVADVESSSGSKNNPWSLTAFGRYPKEENGPLFKVYWQPNSRELKIESLQKGETKFSCSLKMGEETGIEEAQCENFVLFRSESKDINLTTLSYSVRKGFSGEGKLTTVKGVSEKWSFPVLSPLPPSDAGASN